MRGWEEEWEGEEMERLDGNVGGVELGTWRSRMLVQGERRGDGKIGRGGEGSSKTRSGGT